MHFKQIVSPKMFTQKSRQNSEDKRKLDFKRPSTLKKSVKKTSEFNIPCSPKNSQVPDIKHIQNTGSTRKEIAKVRVQSPFVQEKSCLKKDLIFDSKAYFKE